MMRLPFQAPSRPYTLRVGLALAIGGAGGVVAFWLNVPLAFMLGSLFACMIASIAGAPVEGPMKLRTAGLFVVGLFLGESFESGAAERLLQWPATIFLSMLYVPVAAWICFLFYHHVARMDRLTALFSAVPGGLSAVILFSGELGGDPRKVALAQSLRITLLVLSAPAIAFGVMGYAEPDLLTAPEDLAAGDDFLVLVLTSFAMAWVLTKMGVPLPLLIAPVLASAFLRMSGVVDGVLPPWLVKIALVVTGAAIGCRFKGVELRVFLAVAGWTVLGTALLSAIAAVFALVAVGLVGVDLFAALLAYAPGGVAEMSIIAIAVDADPSFVATHHLARIMFILVATPFFAAWLQRRWDD